MTRENVLEAEAGRCLPSTTAKIEMMVAAATDALTTHRLGAFDT